MLWNVGAVRLHTAFSQSADNVAVVVNENSPDSRRVGEYYARTRNLPASNVLRIRTSVDETVDPATFILTIQQPLAAAIARNELQDRLLYLVLTKGAPLRAERPVATARSGASIPS